MRITKVRKNQDQKVVQEIEVILQKYYLLNQVKENALHVMQIVVFQEVEIVLINMFLLWPS